MKINSKILHISPYISTSWNYVSALHIKGNQLIVTLIDGDSITIPNLSQETLDNVFLCHGEFLDQEIQTQNLKSPVNDLLSLSRLPFNFPDIRNLVNQEATFQFAFGGLDSIGNVIQHNPGQKNAPQLPSEVLNKIASIVKIVSQDEISNFPKAEPHCNCVHCQIARTIHHTHSSHNEIKEEAEEEIVTDAELQFQQYEVNQTGDRMFIVIDRLDVLKQYNVYLGDPVGCTCGEAGCEHIIAVLNS